MTTINAMELADYIAGLDMEIQIAKRDYDFIIEVLESEGLSVTRSEVIEAIAVLRTNPSFEQTA